MSFRTAPALTALAAALIAVTGCEQANDAATSVSESVESAGEAAHDHAAHAMDEAGDLVEAGKDKMEGAVEAGQDAAADAKAQGEDLVEAGKEKMEEATGALGDMGAAMQGKVTGLMTEAGNAIGEGNLDKAQTAVDKLKEMDLSSMPSMEQAVEGLQSTITQMKG